MIWDALGFLALGEIPFTITAITPFVGGPALRRKPRVFLDGSEDDETLLLLYWMMNQ